jgi:hypothetical protein
LYPELANTIIARRDAVAKAYGIVRRPHQFGAGNGVYFYFIA